MSKLNENEQIALIKRVFSDNFWEYRYRYALAMFFMAIAAVATGATAYLMRDVIDTVLRGTDKTAVMQLGVAVMVIFITKGLATYGQQVTMAMIGNNLVARLRNRVFNHVVSLPISYFDRTTLGEIFTRLGSGASASANIIAALVTSVGRDVLTLIALAVVMIYQAPLISIVALLIGPVAISQVSRLVKKSKVHARAKLDNSAEISKINKEAVSGIMVIKTYNLENEIKDQMTKAMKEFEHRSNKLAKLAARTSPVMESLGGIAIGVVIIYAGWRAIGDPDYPGQLMSFVTAFLLAYDPAKRLVRLRVTIEPSLVGVQYMYELMDNEQPEQEEEGKPDAKIDNGKIEFSDVSFAYKTDLPVLHNVSLNADQGEKVALVGVSGSGKSTIFKLLLGLYHTDSGAIRIDGEELSTVDLQSVRRRIAYVGQEAYIFTGSVLENIQYGDPSASRDQVEAAANAAYADEFITQLPDGYDTFVGEGGAQLSGGQRQRLAIARAFLKNAPIILLDEATSALDTQSERMIQAALERLMKGRTTLAIAHRLSTVQNSDRIYVMKAGRVVENGSHKELLALGGDYAHLHNLQFRDVTAEAV
ncbi:MAG: ABC transporter ATP-binding protein [Stappiaceae bacterium]